MSKILDWQGREISCLIDENIFSDSKERQQFYDGYISNLEQIIGFRKNTFTETTGVNTPIEFFNKIDKEFHKHPFLKDLFGSYTQFFHTFFLAPYAISCFRDEQGYYFIDDFDHIKDKKERKIAEFVRGINIPLLLWESLHEQERKHQDMACFRELLEKDKLRISYQQPDLKESLEGESLEGILRAEFSTNFWYNILNSSDDCIFISHNLKQKIVTFHDYWFASLLHMLHPKIYYLNFVVGEGKELKELFPYPLFKVILMETDNDQYPLLVEGVLGEDFNKFKAQSETYRDLRDFVDFSIWQFFSNRFQREKPERELLYFPSHSPKKNKPYSQFDEQTKVKYRKGSSLNQKLVLSVPYDKEMARLISNSGTPANEQFSEAFAYSNPAKTKEEREKRVGSFVDLEGIVQGISAKEYVPGFEIKYPIRMPWWGAGVGAAVLIGGLVWGYFLSPYRYVPCVKGTVNNLTVQCMVDATEKTIYHDEIADFEKSGTNVDIKTKDNKRIRVKFNNKEEVGKFEGDVIKMGEFLSELFKSRAPEFCIENPMELDDSYLLNTASCTNSIRIMTKAAALSFKYKDVGIGNKNEYTVGIDDGRRAIMSNIFQSAYELRDPASVDKVIDLYGSKRVFDLIVAANKTAQSTEIIVNTLYPIYRHGKPEEVSKVLDLVGFYLSRGDLQGPTINSRVLDLMESEIAKGDLRGVTIKQTVDVDHPGKDVLEGIRKMALVLSPDALNKLVEFAERHKSHQYVGNLFFDLVRITKSNGFPSHLDSRILKTGFLFNASVNNEEFMSILAVAEMYSALVGGEKIVGVMGTIANKSNFSGVVDLNRVFGTECIFQNFKDFQQDKTKFDGYLEKIIDKVVGLSPDSYFDNPDLLYTLNLCEKK